MVNMEPVTSTGHHLEWIAICPEALLPEMQCIRRAINFTRNEIPQFRDLVHKDYHIYYPLSHALRALVNLEGRKFATPEQLAVQ